MAKINIAELLKDCPKGMELDCAMYEKVEFDYIEQSPESKYPIHCLMRINGGCNALVFTHNGCNDRHPNAKCVIFPKGKTTWEGFHRPFKDGDIVVTTLGNIAIIRKPIDEELFYIYGLMVGNGFYKDETAKVVVERLASEEEKQKLFDAIKDNGYRWNAETKTLEELVEPKFKEGDRIQSKDFIEERTIKICEEDGYWTTVDTWIRISDQDDWELIPNKFDITTLVPFEDKVLVRNDESQRWLPAFWGYKVVDGFITTFGWCKYCIPYKDNENLFKTNNDCDDFYKTWEK